MATIFTTSEQVRISYTDTGRPDGPVLVLLHGLGEGAATWNQVRPALEAGHRVVDVTLRGHTPSDRPGGYSYEAITQDVVELLDGLGLRSVAVLGHSLGGMVAFMLAVRRPDLVGRLLVEDVAPGPPSPRRPTPERPAADLPFDWEMLLQMLPQIAAGAGALREALTGIQAPTLLIGGGGTSHVPQELLDEAAVRIPQADLVTLGGGHSVHTAHPDAFTETVLSWLNRH